ncbi:hypothetical protein [Mycobacterium sp.]
MQTDIEAMIALAPATVNNPVMVDRRFFSNDHGLIQHRPEALCRL